VLTTATLFIAWLLLPTIGIGLWMLHQRRRQESVVPGKGTPQQRAQLALVGFIGVLTAGSFAYRLLVNTRLEQTAALFVGVPALLATAAVFLPARSAIGVACKAVTIGLLISLIFLGEGVVCVLMSAPLFYLVAVLVGWAIGAQRRASTAASHKTFSFLALLAFAPMSLEGVTSLTTINRDEFVSETRIVQASADAVAAAILEQPRFDRALPTYLAMGFPRPTSARVGDGRWVIRMRGGEMRLNGMEPRAGDLVLALDDQGPGFAIWRALSDDSHMTHFLFWQSSRVEWQAIGPQTTRVTWTVRYRRGLDPAWYFGPMERYAMHLAAGYLIEAVATP
jgi:hypothetical protein